MDLRCEDVIIMVFWDETHVNPNSLEKKYISRQYLSSNNIQTCFSPGKFFWSPFHDEVHDAAAFLLIFFFLSICFQQMCKKQENECISNSIFSPMAGFTYLVFILTCVNFIVWTTDKQQL